MPRQEENSLIEQDAFGKSAGLRILLADDSRVMQALLAGVLEDHGHQVTIVGTGLAAYELMSKERFDLVFMDLEMPVMDGREATIAIRRRDGSSDNRTPIIAMTAQASGSFEEHCREIGMDGYVTKPVATEELLALMRRFTG